MYHNPKQCLFRPPRTFSNKIQSKCDFFIQPCHEFSLRRFFMASSFCYSLEMFMWLEPRCGTDISALKGYSMQWLSPHNKLNLMELQFGRKRERKECFQHYSVNKLEKRPIHGIWRNRHGNCRRREEPLWRQQLSTTGRGNRPFTEHFSVRVNTVPTTVKDGFYDRLGAEVFS